MTLSHVILLKLSSVSYDTNAIVNDTILFITLQSLKQGVAELWVMSHYWHWHHVMPVALLIVPMHLLGGDNFHKV